MRIGMFAWETLHSIPVGGVAVHVTELSAALQRRGHEVHVFTRQGEGQPYYENVLGVHHHRVSFPLRPDFVDEMHGLCGSLVDRAWEVEGLAGAFDVLHAHDWLTANAMVWAKEGRRRKSVLTMHSTEYGRNGNQFFGGNAARVQDHERRGTYCADRVITVSRQLRDEISWLYELPHHKVDVIYNGVNSRAFDYHLDTGIVKRSLHMDPMDPMVLFVGRLVVQKGPDILVQAMPGLLNYYPNAKFVMVGDGHMRSEVYMQAHHLGVAHALRLLGHRTGGELLNLFKACDVLAVPSRNEPFGIVILEAWSAGKPVVSTKRGGPAEFVWHGVNGLQIDDTPDSLGWGLGTMLANHDHTRWMGHNGRLAVESVFGWDSIAEQTENTYRCVC